MGNGDWAKVAKGNLFSWLAKDCNLQGNVAIYQTELIKADFSYTIQKNSVFKMTLPSNTVYFLDESLKRRTDIEGQISFSQKTSLILHNTAISTDI